MHRRTFMQLTGLGIGQWATDAWAWAEESDAQKKLTELVHSVREKHKVPGMAAGIVRDGRMVAAAVSGVRHVDKPDLVTLENRFGIGSCTKRMTALAVARVVDSGRISFDTTIEEVLPEVKMRDEYRKVTLAQLLTFRGGIQPYLRFTGPPEQNVLAQFTGTPEERRAGFVAHVLTEEPVAEPGTERHYSNASYAVAAYLAARRTGQSWEELVTEHVFKPLDMTRAGFGRPLSPDRPNEPAMHSNGLGPSRLGQRREPGQPGQPDRPRRQLRPPRPAQPAGNNDAPYRPEAEDNRIDHHHALGAAGSVHCSIGDLCKFAIYELQRGGDGDDPLLSKSTAARMLELFPRREGVPIRGGSNYLSAGYSLWHSRNFAVAAMVNAGGAAPACSEVFETVAKNEGLSVGPGPDGPQRRR